MRGAPKSEPIYSHQLDKSIVTTIINCKPLSRDNSPTNFDLIPPETENDNIITLSFDEILDGLSKSQQIIKRESLSIKDNFSEDDILYNRGNSISRNYEQYKNIDNSIAVPILKDIGSPGITKLSYTA